jgi:hypothetical protein
LMLKLAWLNKLKNSKRSSSRVDSVIRVSLNSAKSQLLMPGP